MKVGVLCEYSGIVRDAFLRRGHDAISCDLLPSDSSFGPHIKGDCLIQDWSSYDLIICFPPCTYLCNSGVRWLGGSGPTRNQERWANMYNAAQFFKRLLELPVPRIAVENPIMHKYGRELIGHDYSQIIQPWQFGHGETKATCLWLKNLPPLRPTNIVAGREGRIHNLPPSADRGKIRSKTYLGIANAMAEQWGETEFVRHLNKVSAEVNTWPKWKQNILKGTYSDNTR